MIRNMDIYGGLRNSKPAKKIHGAYLMSGNGGNKIVSLSRIGNGSRINKYELRNIGYASANRSLAVRIYTC